MGRDGPNLWQDAQNCVAWGLTTFDQGAGGRGKVVPGPANVMG